MSVQESVTGMGAPWHCPGVATTGDDQIEFGEAVSSPTHGLDEPQPIRSYKPRWLQLCILLLLLFIFDIFCI